MKTGSRRPDNLRHPITRFSIKTELIEEHGLLLR